MSMANICLVFVVPTVFDIKSTNTVWFSTTTALFSDPMPDVFSILEHTSDNTFTHKKNKKHFQSGGDVRRI